MQALDDVCPSCGLYLPAAQGVQSPTELKAAELLPVSELYLPPGQFLQLVWATPAHLPAVQTGQDVAANVVPSRARPPGQLMQLPVFALVVQADAAYLPAAQVAQELQLDCPALFWYFPAPQFLQPVCPPLFWYFPAPQFLQLACPALFWYLPAPQLMQSLALSWEA